MTGRQPATRRGARRDPGWRPDTAHVVAHVDRRERVNFVAVDSGRRLLRTRPLSGVTQLAWAPNGRRLHAVIGGQLYAFDPRRRVTSSWSADWAPGAAYRVEQIAVARSRLAVVRAALRPPRGEPLRRLPDSVQWCCAGA